MCDEGRGCLGLGGGRSQLGALSRKQQGAPGGTRGLGSALTAPDTQERPRRAPWCPDQDTHPDLLIELLESAFPKLLLKFYPSGCVWMDNSSQL